jgi:hypothetical protein
MPGMLSRVGTSVGRMHSAQDRVGAGVERCGAGPLVGARAAFVCAPACRPHHGRPQGPSPHIHSSPAPTRITPPLKVLTKYLPLKVPGMPFPQPWKGGAFWPFRVIPSSMLLQGHCAAKTLAIYYEATHPEYPQECVNDLRLEAGGLCSLWTPPQLGIPLQACRFGFLVRGIRGR